MTAVVLTFDNILSQQQTYTEDGFTITAADGSSPGLWGSTVLGFGDRLVDFENQIVTIASDSGTFGVSSIQLEGRAFIGGSINYTFTGHKADGTVVTQTFSLDDQIGLQTFNFDSQFTNLVSLTTDDAPFAHIDNLVLIIGNDAPVAVADTLPGTEDTPLIITAAQLLGNDTDVDSPNSALSIASVTSGAGGTAVLNPNGTVSFTPNSNFNGAANFTYTATDGGVASAAATVTINVAAVNDAPVAVADTLFGTEDTPLTITAAQLLGNDTDVDSPNSALSIASVTSGAGGTAVLNPNGTVSFTPNSNFNGAANFTYTVTDGGLTSAPATVTINIAAVNDAPVITSDGGGAIRCQECAGALNPRYDPCGHRPGHRSNSHFFDPAARLAFSNFATVMNYISLRRPTGRASPHCDISDGAGLRRQWRHRYADNFCGRDRRQGTHHQRRSWWHAGWHSWR